MLSSRGSSSKSIDCIVCGSCVADILVRPVPLRTPVGVGQLLPSAPIEIATGGIVSNSGIGLRRMGLTVGAFSYVGDDDWGRLIRESYEREGIDTRGLQTHPTAPTSTTAVLIDEQAERSFVHSVGAPELLDRAVFLDHLNLFADARAVLVGYYSLMPDLEKDLPEVFAAIRGKGCLTALDAAGDGGGMDPLRDILPHVDLYVPSRQEAEQQTGCTDPFEMVDLFRSCGAPGIVGIKLGSHGAVLSSRHHEYIHIGPVAPPGKVVDTTGAGDCFYAGLIAGLLRGLEVGDSGRLGAAAGACCVTAVGASTAMRSFDELVELAQIEPSEADV